MRAALSIATRSLRQRIRDRSAILFAIVIPLGLAAAFSMLIPRGSTFHAEYVVYDGDGGPVAATLVDHVLGALVETGAADVSQVQSEAAAMIALDAGETSAVILIPAGFSDAIATGTATEVRIVGIPDSPLGTQIARSVVGGFASEVGAIQLAVVTAVDWQPGGSPPALDEGTVAAVRDVSDPIVVSDATMERRQATTASFYAAAMAIMFLFFATIYGPVGILAERRTGTLARLLAAPIRPASIVLGASLASFVLGLVSMTVLVIATTLLLGAEWGPPALVAPLVLSAVIAAMGISMLVCTLARTEDQASGWNAMVAISLAILGGAMIPLSQAPELLLQLGLLTPHAWFLRAVDSMAGASVQLADILPSLLALLAFGVVAGAIGLARSRTYLVAR
jgi:ABC-2 type transport system permease protein